MITEEIRGPLVRLATFKIKDTATTVQINNLENAIRALPEQIPSIISFDWGPDASPAEQKFNAGFSPHFEMTFANLEGRDAYRAHPALKAVIELLLPILDQGHDFDFFTGTIIDEEKRGDLIRFLTFHFDPSLTADAVNEIVNTFRALPLQIPEIISFHFGTDVNPEDDKHNGEFTHHFELTFENEQARSVYINSPAHDAFRRLIGPLVDKGLVNGLVLDFFAGK